MYNADGTENNTQAPAPAATSSSGFGAPVYNQIGDFFKGATGRAATQQEVSQWGTNIDPTYLAKIRDSIYNTDEAKAYSKAQTAPPPAAPPATPPAAPAAGQSAPAATGSPVTANGQIPPPTAPTPAVNGQTPNQTRYVTPVDLATVPNYNPATFKSNYTPTQLSQFATPNQGDNNASQSALMQAILANPGTMNANVVAQMKEAQKQQALSMRDQAQSGMDQSNVAAGRLGSGQATANTMGNQQNAINAILTGNRNTDIQAASTNRADTLNALTASSGLAQDQLQRAISGYQTTLGGQQAADQQGQFASTQDLGVQQANAQQKYLAEQDQLQRLLSQFGINTGVAQNAQQNYGADLAAQLQQFTQNLDTKKFGENQRQFNDTLGYNYNALDQSGQSSLLDYLRSIGA